MRKAKAKGVCIMARAVEARAKANAKATMAVTHATAQRALSKAHGVAMIANAKKATIVVFNKALQNREVARAALRTKWPTTPSKILNILQTAA